MKKTGASDAAPNSIIICCAKDQAELYDHLWMADEGGIQSVSRRCERVLFFLTSSVAGKHTQVEATMLELESKAETAGGPNL
ncbi:MAG: hypothetical protein IT427_05465 [Pirellulales bacterium]|nr:hypothetical protein [Pirellulales bacterium]